jgi:predicted transposase YbfD/YdcC
MLPSHLVDVFSSIKDPRVERTRLHKLVDILTIALLTLINGGSGWSDMELFAKGRETWLRTFLELPHGIPSEDTYRRMFEAIDTKVFTGCMTTIIEDLVRELGGKGIAIDGKTLRRSFDRCGGKSALHVVSAWVTELGVSLGQIAVDKKSNEITAIPALLETLDIAGATVTIDAMGCQKAIAEDIVRKRADYVLAVKDNHPTLHREIVEAFTNFPGEEHNSLVDDEHTTENKGHGRYEQRRVRVIRDIDWLADVEAWQGAACIIEVERTRTVGNEVSVERAHYISSLAESAATIGQRIRSHWSIENTLHWSLDLTFGEDMSRIRDRCSAANLAALRKLVLSLLKRAPAHNTRSLVQRRRLAGWVPDYAFEILAGISSK